MNPDESMRVAHTQAPVKNRIFSASEWADMEKSLRSMRDERDAAMRLLSSLKPLLISGAYYLGQQATGTATDAMHDEGPDAALALAKAAQIKQIMELFLEAHCRLSTDPRFSSL